MTIRPEDVLHVARLAELDVAPGEVERLARELDRIVAYVGRLPASGTDAPAAPFHPGPARALLRPDEVGAVPLARPPSDFAPEFADGFFLVPRLPALDQG
jgi:aspartyl-tRNA(Asn)/glutamyl-tRNA(Gln) amidotransferase subunit C